MNKLDLKISWRSPLIMDAPCLVTLEFKSVSKLRDFINNGDKMFKLYRPPGNFTKIQDSGYITLKVIKIHKIKNTSIDATVERINLRDYNLDLILEAI